MAFDALARLVSILPRVADLKLAIEGDAKLEWLSRCSCGGGNECANIFSYLLSTCDLNLVVYPTQEDKVSVPAPTVAGRNQRVVAVADPLLAEDGTCGLQERVERRVL